MNIEKLVSLLENKLATLNGLLLTATTLGSLEEVTRLEVEILEVDSTLSKLRTLL